MEIKIENNNRSSVQDAGNQTETETTAAITNNNVTRYANDNDHYTCPTEAVISDELLSDADIDDNRREDGDEHPTANKKEPDSDSTVGDGEFDDFNDDIEIDVDSNIEESHNEQQTVSSRSLESGGEGIMTGDYSPSVIAAADNDKSIIATSQPPPVVVEEPPDFSGLELLIKSIEQVEQINEGNAKIDRAETKVVETETSTLNDNTYHGSHTDSQESSGVLLPSMRNIDSIPSVVAESTTQITALQQQLKPREVASPVNGLEILCALADQRFHEEKEMARVAKMVSPVNNKPSVNLAKRKYTRKNGKYDRSRLISRD